MKPIYSFLALALTSVLLISCSSEKKTERTETPVEVNLATPLQHSAGTITLSGKLTAQNSANLSTRLMAYVEKIYVKPGDKVKTGDLLIKLNATDLNAKRVAVLAQIKEAENAAENAERDYKRYTALHAQESVSDKELENMRLNLTSMQTGLQMAREGLKEVDAMLAYTSIKAPFSGIISSKHINEGSMANPGMPLLTLEQGGTLQVTASVPETYIGSVAVGDSVDVEVKTNGQMLTGQVCELSPSSLVTSGQYALKVKLNNVDTSNLRAGMYVSLQLNAPQMEGEAPKMLIEKDWLIHREQLSGVYTVNADNRVTLRWLRLGKSYGNLIEVLGGISANERIVSHAEGKLYNGKKVTPIQS